mmetsp:Transcript_19790/g.27624  ORF Transcript_19790/g.27624 Transcript_19790/m.27624 type:complete len:357 (+) Transcript_19790:40-1110(+)
MKRKQKTTIQHLPVDVHNEILRLLDPVSILNVARVNRYFRDLIAKQESFLAGVKSHLISTFILSLIPTKYSSEFIHNLDDWVSNHVLSNTKLSEKSPMYVRALLEHIHSQLFNPQYGSGRKKTLTKLIILGDSGVGKTSLMRKYVHQRFTTHYKATIGGEWDIKEIMIGNHIVTCQFWDTAGQERFQALGAAFYRGADAVVITYDLMQASTFNNIESWINEFLDQSLADPNRVPIILCGNKLDLLIAPEAPVENKKKKQQQVKTDSYKRSFSSPSLNIEPVSDRQIQSLAAKLHLPWVYTSAKDNINVDVLFELANVSSLLMANFLAPTDNDLFLPTIVDQESPNSAWNWSVGCSC